ncbi:hypothetical protein ONS95_009062 [Cadophora gregata]|uniref:uncharacterized protein n=1 Tax=Cadophora gregata TaxID=51156 RepID=UPI0026DAEA07|nr:uncharacterized protein ONS95_009062 [Cadophora gregata]KAK0124076.1 hypothetical protein ONS95_009062 [Cadophora gregata]
MNSCCNIQNRNHCSIIKEDADVDYTFVQDGIDNEHITYTANCGNISAGVGTFAIDEGLVKKKGLVRFIHDLKYEDLSAENIKTLKLFLLDHFGVVVGATHLAKESTVPFLKAVTSLNSTTTGSCTVVANGQSFSPPYGPLLNGALAHSLDFDDTHSGSMLHPGVSIIDAAVAEAERQGDVSTSQLFTALAAGYEFTCQLGVGLGTGGHRRGFHNTSTARIFGAVAAICKLRDLDTITIENAFGLASSKAAGLLQYLANGSWNKRLNPGLQRTMLSCVSHSPKVTSLMP